MEKVTWGFLIYKIWHILKHFTTWNFSSSINLLFLKSGLLLTQTFGIFSNTTITIIKITFKNIGNIIANPIT